MKIVLIGPGSKSIPPKGWGAVESLIWDYHTNLNNKGHNSIILNTTNLHEVIEVCNKIVPDIVYIMYDDYIVIAPYLRVKKIFYMSHFAYITHPDFEKKYSHYFNNYFKKAIEYKNIVTINAISNQIKNIYIKYGFPENKINVIQNGARDDLFIFNLNPKYNKSIYIGKIETRKRQYLYQKINNIDFAGNYQDSEFDLTSNNYLGEWTKDTLYNNLSNYVNLILLSDGEADPLVVKEALMAGLGVVVSECASANLDKDKEFIDIIPDSKLFDLEYVEKIIINNRNISIEKRNEIRKYALEKFSWKNIVDKFLEKI